MDEDTVRSLDPDPDRPPLHLQNNDVNGMADPDSLPDLTCQDKNGPSPFKGTSLLVKKNVLDILEDVPARLGRHLKQVLGQGHARSRLGDVHILRFAPQNLEVGPVFFESRDGASERPLVGSQDRRTLGDGPDSQIELSDGIVDGHLVIAPEPQNKTSEGREGQVRIGILL